MNDIKYMTKSLLSFWSLDDGLTGIGNMDLLDRSLTAFFASRQCSGVVIRAAMDWALEQAREKNLVISGFHSPLELSVLKVMLAASAPCVVVLARRFEQNRLPADWLVAAQKGTIAIVSVEKTTRRLITELAAKRNDWIAKRAAQILVAPSEGGHLQQQSDQWVTSGLGVKYF